MTYKIGDRIRLKEKIWFVDGHKAGDILTLEKRCSERGWDTQPSGYYREDEFELVEPEPEAKPQQFKVGDKVRLTGRYTGYDAGTVVTIDDVDDDDPEIPYLLKLPNGGTSWAVARRVEAIPVEMPATPEFGITPDGLADFFEGFIRAAKARVTGVGAEQYSGNGSQKFEHMSVAELIQYAREEVQDIAVYGAMLDVRLQRVLEALNSKGISVVNL